MAVILKSLPDLIKLRPVMALGWAESKDMPIYCHQSLYWHVFGLIVYVCSPVTAHSTAIVPGDSMLRLTPSYKIFKTSTELSNLTPIFSSKQSACRMLVLTPETGHRCNVYDSRERALGPACADHRSLLHRGLVTRLRTHLNRSDRVVCCRSLRS